MPSHACALLGEAGAGDGPQGEVWCWGDNSSGQLGNDSGPEVLPKQPRPPGNKWEPLTGMAHIALMGRELRHLS